MDPVTDRDFLPELEFSFSRSSGPGGQQVNKVCTRVELRFHVAASNLLTEEEKTLVLEKLTNRINSQGELLLVSQSERSQAKNRDKVTERFYALLVKALTPRKRRKRTMPSTESVARRLEAKRQQAEKKRRRKRDERRET